MRRPVHPGAILREDIIAELRVGIGEFSCMVKVPEGVLVRVTEERDRISPATAQALEAAGFGTSRAWLDMQAAHDGLDRGHLTT